MSPNLLSSHVSIIMPCFNAGEHLHRSIPSIQRQTCGNWTLHVVDDGSTDQSWEILQTFAVRDSRIKLSRQANSGAAAARNTGLKSAAGAYVAFLDADDTWHPEFLERMVQALDQHPDAGLAYCGWQNIGLGKGRDDPFVPPDYETPQKVELLLGGCRWPIHAALTRRNVVMEAGGFDPTLTSCMDYDLWLRIGATHKLVRVPLVLAYYHHHGGAQITSNRARIALTHLRVQEKFLQTRPDIVTRLGKKSIRQLTLGHLLERAYECYWRRDLGSARVIMRQLMKRGYGSLRDWTYMLPSWLPESWHRWILLQRDKIQGS